MLNAPEPPIFASVTDEFNYWLEKVRNEEGNYARIKLGECYGKGIGFSETQFIGEAWCLSVISRNEFSEIEDKAGLRALANSAAEKISSIKYSFHGNLIPNYYSPNPPLPSSPLPRFYTWEDELKFWVRKSTEENDRYALLMVGRCFQVRRESLGLADAVAYSVYLAVGGRSQFMFDPYDLQFAVNENKKALSELAKALELSIPHFSCSIAAFPFIDSIPGSNGRTAIPEARFFSVGEFYETGKWGFPRECSEALYWYKKAAEKGHLEAQKNAGRNSLQLSDLDQARHWYQLAAVQGDADAIKILNEPPLKPSSLIQSLFNSIFTRTPPPKVAALPQLAEQVPNPQPQTSAAAAAPAGDFDEIKHTSTPKTVALPQPGEHPPQPQTPPSAAAPADDSDEIKHPPPPEEKYPATTSDPSASSSATYATSSSSAAAAAVAPPPPIHTPSWLSPSFSICASTFSAPPPEQEQKQSTQTTTQLIQDLNRTLEAMDIDAIPASSPNVDANLLPHRFQQELDALSARLSLQAQEFAGQLEVTVQRMRSEMAINPRVDDERLARLELFMSQITREREEKAFWEDLKQMVMASEELKLFYMRFQALLNAKTQAYLARIGGAVALNPAEIGFMGQVIGLVTGIVGSLVPGVGIGGKVVEFAMLKGDVLMQRSEAFGALMVSDELTHPHKLAKYVALRLAARFRHHLEGLTPKGIKNFVDAAVSQTLRVIQWYGEHLDTLDLHQEFAAQLVLNFFRGELPPARPTSDLSRKPTAVIPIPPHAQHAQWQRATRAWTATFLIESAGVCYQDESGVYHYFVRREETALASYLGFSILSDRICPALTETAIQGLLAREGYERVQPEVAPVVVPAPLQRQQAVVVAVAPVRPVERDVLFGLIQQVTNAVARHGTQLEEMKSEKVEDRQKLHCMEEQLVALRRQMEELQRTAQLIVQGGMFAGNNTERVKGMVIEDVNGRDYRH